MARRRRKKKNDVIDLSFGLAFFIGFYAWVKTQNYVLGGLVTGVSLFALLLIVFYIKHLKKVKLLSSGIDIVDKMSGSDFENFLAAHFSNLGYKVKMTPVTNDFGCDLILSKDNFKTVVQAKRWNESVGIKAVQEIVGAIKYYNAHSAMVVTNRYFTDSAKELASSSNVVLWDRNKLIEVMRGSYGREGVQRFKELVSTAASDSASVNICPKCNSELVLRTSKRGKFYGCSTFPKCRFTKDLA